MLAFVLIVGFPVLLAVGFGGFYAVSYAMGRGAQFLDRAGWFLYMAFLGVPLTAVLLAVSSRGSSADIGMVWPEIGGLGDGGSLAAAIAIGLVSGFAVFYNELFLTRALHRWTQRRAGVIRKAIEGNLQQFAQRQQKQGMTMIFIVSIGIVFAEELIWRGYLLRFLMDHFALSTSVAVLISAISFGLNHYYFGLRNIVFKTFLGVVWALLYLATGSLLTVFVSHMTFETLALRGMR